MTSREEKACEVPYVSPNEWSSMIGHMHLSETAANTADGVIN